MFGTVFEVEGSGRDGQVLVVCEHASRRLPNTLGDLGLSPVHLESHIAWDIGAMGLAKELSKKLNGPLVRGAISRLVYDLNRPPEAHDAIPVQSEATVIPGNRNLSASERAARVEQIYRPFEAALDATIQTRPGLEALVTVHSYTPVWFGDPREVEIGILCGRDPRLAERVLRVAREAAPHRDIRLNAPYGPEDGVAHTLDRHGAGNDLPSVMIEIRNDLIADDARHTALATDLAGWVRTALASLKEGAAL
ncbi:MAG: N-formylglutamate amidohydrolase [Dinoroseobacter sp.]|nr:N-formylglutamate amidohydrolase [Dinoroseobacter sp.]